MPIMTYRINFDKDDFITALFDWFQANKRDLPWRKTYSPYHVWISEMMLQQTQMERGVQYFNRWIQEFSSPTEVADAPLEKILQLWEGLGYYSRAKNIYRSAQIIRDRYNGEIPCNEEKIKALAGIGDYTLCAIMGIAFEKDYATVDANVERVFARLFNCTEPNLKKALRPLVQKLLPCGQARIYNQALMELGALVCKKNPRCRLCPLTDFCESKKLGLEKERPLPKEKKQNIPVLASFCIIKNAKNQELIRQRKSQKLWNGMWEYIGIDSIVTDKTDKAENEHAKPALQEHVARQSLIIELGRLFSLTQKEKEEIEQKMSQSCLRISSSYTNHKLTACFFILTMDRKLEEKIHIPEHALWTGNAEKFAMPSHHRKAHQKLNKEKLPQKAEQGRLL